MKELTLNEVKEVSGAFAENCNFRDFSKHAVGGAFSGAALGAYAGGGVFSGATVVAGALAGATSLTGYYIATCWW